MQRKTKGLGVGILLAAMMVVGCYRPAKIVRLDYKHVPKRRAVSQGVTVTVGSFKDNRLEKDVGGVYRDTQMMAPAHAWGSIEDWVEGALVEELTLGGFDVARGERNEAAEETTGYYISGQVMEAQARQAEAISAQVVLLVMVEWNGEELFTRTYRGNAGVIHVFGTGKEFNDALSKALEKALTQLVADMQSLAAATSSGE